MQLIVTPEKYIGKMVEIKGYLKRGIDLKLYPNHLSASMRDEPSSITILERPEGPLIYNACDSKYVLVKGRFDTEEGVFYFVRDVEFVTETETLKSCWSTARN